MFFMEKMKLIAIDWGTTNFRAFLLDEEGQIQNKHSAARGIAHLKATGFPTVLANELQSWLKQYPKIPVIMSGMIGSRQGWHEVPYCHCPIPLKNLAKHLYKISTDTTRTLAIVPGLAYQNSDKTCSDVMRGEETQILGALIATEKKDAVICLPGTHSKWAQIKENSLIEFTTYMTGELFALLSTHSMLAKIMENSTEDENTFKQGLAFAQQSFGLSALLFNVRAQVLLGHIPSQAARSYLSGLLIGYEIAHNSTQQEIVLIADEKLAYWYGIAFDYLKRKYIKLDGEEITAKGLFYIAQEAGLYRHYG